MDSAQKQYLILYALIVIPLAVSFFFIRRSPAPPVKLQLRSGDPESPLETQSHARVQAQPPPPPPAPAAEPAPAPRRGPRQSEYRPRREASPPKRPPPMEMALNVFFMWNGHSWDAYEVLGIPAGSSREAAMAAFQKAAAGCDAESLLFFQAALDAIVKSASTR
jgi:hypothetical protein